MSGLWAPAGTPKPIVDKLDAALAELERERVTARVDLAAARQDRDLVATRLGRDVAIKVLPPEFTEDPDRLRRFESFAFRSGRRLRFGESADDGWIRMAGTLSRYVAAAG